MTSDVLVMGGGATGQLAAAYLRKHFPDLKGVTGYLEVLPNETNAFSTELGLVQAQLNELLAVVQLYQAFGGGWQQ
jgi:glycine/D-amino acid oxidase-like deaminating enzyme